ncbi:hypothetical protein C8A03DRAFT_18658 [Achaetomium macrosporum]|uniref:DUF3626 domain-containing protein n=1 Tax=Achaetomium macrosporum TaxID=79813 RepID=A0AAN7C3M2_9PEZI|nr:hypothetical protein C8A03DRAFT_18658 [Achaetomium macrosporum]
MDLQELLPSPSSPPLHPSQQGAMSHIRTAALASQPIATQTIHHILRMSNLLPPAEIHVSLLSAIRTQARVALHFHPDRPVGDNDENKTIAQCLLAEGVYRNQFETGVSNGSVSAFKGGVRDLWERELFDGAYHNRNDSHDEEEDGEWRSLRPKYGALDLLGAGITSDDGPAPRFGSCYLVLKREVLERCTFTFGGSQDLPRWRGTMDCFDGVLAAVLEEAFVREAVLGMQGVRPPKLVRSILSWGGEDGMRKRVMSRNLDHYIEAQVHGEVRLDRDVEMLVADPSFRGGDTGTELVALSDRFGFPLRWHAGSHIGVGEIPADFRGPTMPSLAARVARDGIVDARAIGDAVRELKRNPDVWTDRGSYDEVLQELKLLWHVLVRYGRSPDAGQNDANP